MNIEFTSRRARLHDGVKELFEKKLGKLEKVLPPNVQAHVFLRGENKGVSLDVTFVGRQRTWTATDAVGGACRFALSPVTDACPGQSSGLASRSPAWRSPGSCRMSAPIGSRS